MSAPFSVVVAGVCLSSHDMLSDAGEAAFLLGVHADAAVLDASGNDVSDAAFRAAFHAVALSPDERHELRWSDPAAL
jgi:hypothetical protein